YRLLRERGAQGAGNAACAAVLKADAYGLGMQQVANALLREGWRKLLPRAIADPLNPHSWRGGRGHGVSALEMPQAPAQPGWDLLNEAHPPARCL
ncbi:DUF3327 domain-containing protein, partial [Acinetobacter baumannii]|nr:DUF3327 domain-containing protein [Acinetobacter baumannii]